MNTYPEAVSGDPTARDTKQGLGAGATSSNSRCLPACELSG